MITQRRLRTFVVALTVTVLVPGLVSAAPNASAESLVEQDALALCPDLAVEASQSLELREAIEGVEMALPEGPLTVQSVAQAIVDSGASEQFPELGVLSSSSSLAAASSSATVQGLCIRVAWGPGKVKWEFSNPGNKSPNYFSVKPESSNSLIWAQTPGQDIDGVYRGSWGSCTALKVPD
ncbi:MAG: hypothetical protein LBU05_01730, partial [Bifidobacteriaceae bacterium]|nr:hypothetical protein [Bifidobacteriaceae bacterium]